jgi:diaminohydroxyphosphoribosylaminopyrimidine deaminase/5-amino-6-(5-phosphoribosylamino)uracil reductase
MGHSSTLTMSAHSPHSASSDKSIWSVLNIFIAIAVAGFALFWSSAFILGSYNQSSGAAKAEAAGLTVKNVADAANILSKSTLYVNLEPCAHTGKTPPCADLIIKYRIPKVVISNIDPFGSVNGKGVDRLKNAGVEVNINVLKEEGYELNKRFFT